MVFLARIRPLPPWAIFALAVILLAATAQTVWALSCDVDRNEKLTLEIESIEIDGVPQDKLPGEHRQKTGLAADRSADRLQLSTFGPVSTYGSAPYSVIELARKGTEDANE